MKGPVTSICGRTRRSGQLAVGILQSLVGQAPIQPKEGTAHDRLQHHIRVGLPQELWPIHRSRPAHNLISQLTKPSESRILDDGLRERHSYLSTPLSG